MGVWPVHAAEFVQIFDTGIKPSIASEWKIALALAKFISWDIYQEALLAIRREHRAHPFYSLCDWCPLHISKIELVIYFVSTFPRQVGWCTSLCLARHRVVRVCSTALDEFADSRWSCKRWSTIVASHTSFHTQIFNHWICVSVWSKLDLDQLHSCYY